MAPKNNIYYIKKDKNNSSLLPYVLDLISRRRNLSITVDELCEEIKEAVLFDHINDYGTLRNAVNFALEVGMNLGILTLIDERVRVPFNFRMKQSESNDDTTQRDDVSTAEDMQNRPAITMRKPNELKAQSRRAQTVRRPATRSNNNKSYKARKTVARRKPATVRAVQQRRSNGNRKKGRQNGAKTGAARRRR